MTGLTFSMPKKYAFIILVVDTKGSVKHSIFIKFAHRGSCKMLSAKQLENNIVINMSSMFINPAIQKDEKIILLFLSRCSAINLVIARGSAKPDIVRSNVYVGNTKDIKDTPSLFKYLV